MTEIVVSRRDGILRAPDGTKHRVARGKTLAEADHPAVLANPQDWVPMVVTLTIGTERSAAALPEGAAENRVAQLEDEVAELEDTLAQRDAEMTRLAEGLAQLGVHLPAEGEREPGWLVDLALDVAAAWAPRSDFAGEAPLPAHAPAPSIAPPKARKRAAPPLVTRTGDDD